MADTDAFDFLPKHVANTEPNLPLRAHISVRSMTLDTTISGQ